MNYVYEKDGKIAHHDHMGELKTPHLPLAPTKIQQVQATKIAGLVEHSGDMVAGRFPETARVPIYEQPMPKSMPKLPDHLHKVPPSATPPCFGHIKMEMHDKKGISLVYIG